MKNRELSTKAYFLNNKQKIKYKLLPSKSYLLSTTKNNSPLKKKKFEIKMANKSCIEPLAPTISTISNKRKTHSMRNINKQLFNLNHIKRINKISIKSFECKYNNIYKSINIQSKNNNNNKNELKEQFNKTKFRLFCKMIGNNYNKAKDIDCILQCPYRGVEKIKITHKNNNQVTPIKRTISGYNIKNNNNYNYQTISPLKTISKKSGISTTVLRKVIDYSLNHQVKNVYKIINEKIENEKIINNYNSIYLNIPLKSPNIKNKNNKLNKTKSFNCNKTKEDSIFFDTFIPEDFRITSRNYCDKTNNNGNNIKVNV